MSITRDEAAVGARVMIAGNDEPATIIEVDREGWYVVRLWHRGRHVGDVVKPLAEMRPVVDDPTSGSANRRPVAEVATFYTYQEDDGQSSLARTVARIAALPTQIERLRAIDRLVDDGDDAAVREGFAPNSTAHRSIHEMVDAHLANR